MHRLSFAFLFVVAGYISPAAAAGHVVDWNGDHDPGTIVIQTENRRLYLVTEHGEAISYPIAVGKEGAQWHGTTWVTRKAANPNWYPTPNMRARNPKLPAMVKGGPGNPLGSRALYLDEGLLRIHGNNDSESIGKSISSGCFRLYNEDIEDLYEMVDPGAVVIVAE